MTQYFCSISTIAVLEKFSSWFSHYAYDKQFEMYAIFAVEALKLLMVGKTGPGPTAVVSDHLDRNP